MVIRMRVAASKISTVGGCSPQEIAMDLLHGDHAAAKIFLGNRVATTLGSHEVGSPCTILIKGWACDPYNPRTSDFWGDSGRAEW